MGVYPKGSSCDSTCQPNPNKYKFRVIDKTYVNGKTIMLVKYDGCTTFNGQKLLLYNGTYVGVSELDPHLLGNGHMVIARFEPNQQGYDMAIASAIL